MAGESWSVWVDVSSGDYTIPAGVIVQEMRVRAAGRVRMENRNGDLRDFQATSFDIFKLGQPDWKKVRQFGTDPDLRTNQVQLIGIQTA